ncbi:MAG: response regulator [Candidatus Poribacteria bacterium]|nr:response regulator [Candidatus Poribacteria bacterium]
MQITQTKQRCQRRFRRFTVTTDVKLQIRLTDCGTDLTGKLVDVSYPFAGLELTCSQEIPPGSGLRIKLATEPNRQAVTFEGVATWCFKKSVKKTSQPFAYHVGVCLKEAETEDQGQLQEAMADLVPERVREQYRLLRERAAEMGIEYTDEIDWVISPWIEQDYRLNALIEVMHEINSTLQQDPLLTRIMEAARRLVCSEASSLMMLDEQTQELTIYIPTGPVKAKIVGRKLPSGEGIAGWAAKYNEPIIVEDAKNDPRHYSGVDAESGFETRSLICVPLRNSAGQVIGVLEAMNRLNDTRYTDQDLNIFLAFANQAAMALENARLHQNLHQAYAQLKATQKQIVQQERLKALGTMASGVVHDFNNMLTVILGGISLLYRDETLTEKQQRYVQIVNTSAHDAAEVVARLREFYRHRQESEGFAPIQLNELIEQSISMTRPKWKDMQHVNGVVIQMNTDLAKNLPAMSGNASEIRDAITNLIFNGVDAMPEGGTLTLRTRTTPDHVIFEISDTGTGMPEEVRTRCLEPFFSTKGDKGTGLGLSMVYGSVQRHNGIVNIQSEIGQGTTVQIKLPIAELGSKETVHLEASAIRPLNILVIDDEQSVREVLRELLECDGHSVEFAATAREGLAQFLTGTFDLVITDQGMPDMEGNQLARHIKEIDANQPIILITGWDKIMEGDNERTMHVDLVVNKPITLETLRQALGQVLHD